MIERRRFLARQRPAVLRFAAPSELGLASRVASELERMAGGIVRLGPPIRTPMPPDVKAAVGTLPPGTVAIVPGELSAPGLRRVLGWSDGSAAAVTTEVGAPVADRVARLVAHEAAHLAGLGHCRRRNCLARSVSAPEELDALDGFCPRCSRALSSRPGRA